MRHGSKVAIAVMAAWMIWAGAMAAQQKNPPPPVTGAQQQEGFIPAKELAGKFYHGDGTGSNRHLTLKADHTYDYQFTGCLGVYAEGKGSWKWDKDVLVLTSAKDDSADDFMAVEKRLVPARLGERLYLVREDKVKEFVHEIRVEKDVPQKWMSSYYMAVDDKYQAPKATAEDKLILPPAFDI